MTTYYAAPESGPGGQSIGSSSNNGLSQTTPFLVSDFWDVANAGDTLNLLDGVYVGSNSVIDPPSGLSGSGNPANWPPGDRQIIAGSNPITVRALNDGGVLIDGEFQRSPLSLSGNHWFVVEGVNVRNSNFALVSLSGPSSNNIVRRVVGWDTLATRGQTKGVDCVFSTCVNNMVEDCAMFGVFGGGFVVHGSVNGPVIFRRCYADGQAYMGGEDTSQSAFHPNYSSTQNVTLENCIGRLSYSQQPFSHCFAAGAGYPAGCVDNYRQSGPGARYIFRLRGGDANPPPHINTHVYGSLGYTLDTDRWRYNGIQVGPVDALRAPVAPNIHGVHIVDTMMFIHPSNPTFNFAQGFHLAHSSVPPGGYDLVASNITSVRGSLGDHIEGFPTTNEWEVTNYSRGSSLSSVQNPWTTSTGANLCVKYVNRIKTASPLWPWPMNSRIKSASQMTSRYSGPCNTCRWGATGAEAQAPLRSPIDVTQQIQSILGAIPSQCWDETNLLVSNASPVLPTESVPPPTSINPPGTIDSGGNFVPPVGDCVNAVKPIPPIFT